jgi:heat shock protein HslJ
VENHSYSVRAAIKLEGKLIFTSTQSYPVITRGNPQEVNIPLHSVPASELNRATPPPGTAAHLPSRYALERTDWKLTHLGEEPAVVPPDQPEPSIALNPGDHRVSGSGGCNRITGTYQLDGQSLRFSQMASTMMACTSGMDQERSYLRALEMVRTWKIKGRHLELYGEDGKLIARFEARDKK